MEAKVSVAVVTDGRAGARGPARAPRSVTSMGINLLGVGAMVGALAALRARGASVPEVPGTLMVLGAYAGTVIALEAIFLKTWRRPSTGFDFSRRGKPHYGRALVKLFGFYATLGLGLGVYALFPEYRGGFYYAYYQMLRMVLPVVAGLAVPYFLLLERYNQRPHDGFWNLSLALAGKFRQVNRKVLSQHLLGWLVKLFFTPLMFIYCMNGINRLRWYDLHSVFVTFGTFFDFTYDTLFNLDVVLAVTGYLLTIRLFDSHLRSAEPTLLGWFVALSCYQPFWSFFEGNYLPYGSGGTTWGYWFSGSPVAYRIWGSVILALTAIYLWATLPFGIRFSNLTHRGVLTNGPYRFTKHPAYVSKNLSWWLISMPFLSNVSWTEALRHSLMLLCLNLIYFLRARTEERHLSQDPDYVAYATAMERKGLFRWVGRLVPAMRFRQGQLFNV